jgi:hypothetical protein
VAVTLVFYKEFAALAFDREFAAVRGGAGAGAAFPVLAMIGVSVVMVIRVVGLILVMALLDHPHGAGPARLALPGRDDGALRAALGAVLHGGPGPVPTRWT